MGEKIVIGPITKGLQTNVTAFTIDNDAFPTLTNAYQWRGRIRRKRGTEEVCRLSRFFSSISTQYIPVPVTQTLALVTGAGNLLTGFVLSGIEANASIAPKSIKIVNGASTYVDTKGDGDLYLGAVVVGTVNYVTGAIAIVSAAGAAINASFIYYPLLPVMGLKAIDLPDSYNLAFDTVYSYEIESAPLHDSYAVNFYKNPLPAAPYAAKTVWTPFKWTGLDYQQFQSCNYEGVTWVTNGFRTPFSSVSAGMQYKPIKTVTVTSASGPAIATIEITAHGLVVGDFVFINEVNTTTGINGQTGYITAFGATPANEVVVNFPDAVLGGAPGSGGIAQYLTNTADATKSNLRWYDGAPCSFANPSVCGGPLGWVNFAPPLAQNPFNSCQLDPEIWYLVGARTVMPFKDRLLFIGPVLQTSSAGSQVYVPDAVVYSQDGTPFYTASWDATSATPTYNPLLVPPAAAAQPMAWWQDQPGPAGYINAGSTTPIITATAVDDVIIMGFSDHQSRFVYTGNDLLPFLFYPINSDLGARSTSCAISLERSVLSLGTRGFITTTQTSCERFDLANPDYVFTIGKKNNGNERCCAIRDFQNEWLYYTVPNDTDDYTFPTLTFFYNYRDNSWAMFDECYTAYGVLTTIYGNTWATIGDTYPTWSAWNDPWNAGTSATGNPVVVAGTPQGYVVIKGEGTGEAPSIAIKSIVGSTVTAPNHCLDEDDYIVLEDCLGPIGSQVNGKIFQVLDTTASTFDLDPSISAIVTDYHGLGQIRRMYVPQIQSKQFPCAWSMGRKTRLGPQQYLLTKTSSGQVQLLIFLSQDDSTPYNLNNDSQIYTTILLTCPEGSALTPTASTQNQIWHRVSTGLIGDTVQIGLTLSDDQMKDVDLKWQEIELHSIILDVSPSQVLA